MTAASQSQQNTSKESLEEKEANFIESHILPPFIPSSHSSCHMCWAECYRLMDVREKEARARKGKIKNKVRELMDKGYMYGEAVYLATFNCEESKERME